MTSTRALRILFVANDGLSVGHVMRTLAIARALPRRAAERRMTVRSLLATTSEAHELLSTHEELVTTIRLPAPAAARRAGFSDQERRHLVSGTALGIANAFAPDLIVVDTFPSGPHGELRSIANRSTLRALVRRHVPDERASDPTLIEGLEHYDLAIIADDPLRRESPPRLPVGNVVRVPPITLTEPREAMDRDDARRELGLPAKARIVLVTSGGGGDGDAVARAHALAATILDHARDDRHAGPTVVALALGPLAPGERASSCHSSGSSGLHVLRRPVLAPFFAAFDGAFAPAGYNTAHELAKAGVPTALFAQPRPFDDQAGRAARFAAASLAVVLERLDPAAVVEALDWMTNPKRAGPSFALEHGGADRAADALLDLFARDERATGPEPRPR